MKKLELLVWLLPSSALKNKVLRMFGHDISPSASIGPVLALNVGRAVIGSGTTIAALNVFRSLRLLKMGDGATMGSFNMISAHPAYQALHPDVGSLIMGEGAAITSRHNVDCSGKVRIGDMSAVAGQRTTILSHEIDIVLNVQSAGQVVIGERCAVLTNCLVLKGAVLPPHSLLIANSMLIRSRELNPAAGIYGGSPAQFIRTNPADDESWFERKKSATTELRIDLPRGANSNGRACGPRQTHTSTTQQH
ncbi:acyltransferase [Mycolicibacterium lutetiense]